MSGRRGRFGRLSLAARVVIAQILLLALLLIIVLVTHNRLLDERRDSEIAGAGDTGQAVAGIIDGFANDLEAAMLSLALSLERTDGPITPDNASGPMSALAAEYGLLRAIFVTDLDGIVVATDRGTGVGIDLGTRPYMQDLREGAENAWGEGVVGVQTGEVTATYGRPLHAADGSTRAYLIAAFYPPRLAERLSGAVPSDADVTIVDRVGFVLYSTKHPDLAADRRDVAANPDIAAALRGQRVRLDDRVVHAGDESQFGIIVPIASTDWAVAYTRPLAPLDAMLMDQLLLLAGLVTGGVILAGIALTLATRRITRPLRLLAATATAIARGERPEVSASGGAPEINQLADAMAVMSTAVAEREDALRRESERRAILAESSRAFNEAGLELDVEFATIAQRVAGYLGDGCSILLIEGETLKPAAIEHPLPASRALARDIFEDTPVRVGEGVSGSVAASGDATLITNITPDELRAGMDQVHRVAGDRQRPHSFVSVPLKARGRTLGVITAWRDVTRRPYTDEDLRLAQEIADRAALAIDNARLFGEAAEHAVAVERALDAHEEFVAVVSHDLKNPLAAISAGAQLVRRRIQRGAADDAWVLGEMERIEDTVDKTVDEIGDLLDQAHLHSGQPVVLSPRSAPLLPMLRSLADRYRNLSERHRIEVSSSEAEITGDWDERQLERAFSNLISNAIKYSPDGGTVSVTAARDEREQGAWAVVEVRDTGIGIPSTALARVFDRFFRASNVIDSMPGSGLGLSGVRSIIEAHGGTVAVESVLGQGSTFRVRLPL